MRNFLILFCAAIAALCAVIYARSAESLGFSIGGYGMHYSHPNALALGGAVLFGIFAVALVIEGFTIAKKNTPPPTAPPQPQIIIVPPWQTPPPAQPPENKQA